MKDRCPTRQLSVEQLPGYSLSSSYHRSPWRIPVAFWRAPHKLSVAGELSLAREANDLYGGGRQPAQIKDPGIRSQYMDLLFGDPASQVSFLK
jgi:hypothetical protein